MTRRLAVSDIHGEGRRLVQALAKAGYEPGSDRLFLLGDYIDRGTDSRATVQIVQSLVRDGAIALKGNHDAMPREALDRSDFSLWMYNGAGETVRSYGGMMPDDVIMWLDNLPLYHEEPDCVLVHAGLFPRLSLEEQNPSDFLWIREEFYENYRGPKRVIFGHTPTWHLHRKGEPWYGLFMLGIDTGAAYGGPLTVVDIDSGYTWTA